MNYTVYILKCANGNFYTGITTNINRRIKQHNGELPGGPKYTIGLRPVRLVYSESAVNRSAAQQREYAIKQLSREQKLALCIQHEL
jgi:putative endonuclease